MPYFGKAPAHTIHIKSSPDGAFLLLLIGLLRAGAPPSVIYKKQVFMGCFPPDHQSTDWWNSYLKLFGLGAKGAAIATVVSFAVGLVYTRIWSYRLTGTKGNIRIVLHAFAAILMAAVLYI